jgi:hypothetical protein
MRRERGVEAFKKQPKAQVLKQVLKQASDRGKEASKQGMEASKERPNTQVPKQGRAAEETPSKRVASTKP